MPFKKRKLDDSDDNLSRNHFHESVSELELGHELELEIRLKQRLATTLESRITWALILQESLRSSHHNVAENSTDTFKDAALDALDAIDAPCDIIFTRQPTLPLAPLRKFRPHLKQFSTRVVNPKPKFLYIRSSSLTNPHERTDTKNATHYILTCPTCLRTSFTSLQGLLNHARIAHGMEWGSHDECVRACAVPREVGEGGEVSEDGQGGLNLEEGVEVGTGAGVLPGLRSLFQMAVGDDRYTPSHRHRADTEGDEGDDGEGGGDGGGGRHLTRTLGLHKDTPALAPFLGKVVHRRGIKVWDDGGCEVDTHGFSSGDKDKENLDVDAGEEQDVQIAEEYCDAGVQMAGTSSIQIPPQQVRKRKRVWRMPYAHRNVATDMDSSSPPPPTGTEIRGAAPASHTLAHSPTRTKTETQTQRGLIADPKTDITTGPMVAARSRFHIVARIIVADRSFWVPIERRAGLPPTHTHKWMIYIDSPSYSHHITTLLTSVTVASLSDPDSTAVPPLTTTNPPFVVVGSAERPFLARVELGFSGIRGKAEDAAKQQEQKQTVVLEHWVDLDPMRGTSAVLGEEQVVDVELDRGTEFLPVRRDYLSIGTKALWDRVGGVVGDSGKEDGRGGGGKGSGEKFWGEIGPGHSRVLSGLVGRFPMTLKDVKGRMPLPVLPYKLATTPAQFKNFVMGRRKAIEWGRARALGDAYNEALLASSSPQGLTPLTTADVFTWLEEEGHFLRAVPRSRPSASVADGKGGKVRDMEGKKVEERWCGICGHGMDAHRGIAVGGVEKAGFFARDPDMKVVSADGKETGEEAGGLLCEVIPRELQTTKMPIVDIRRLLARDTSSFTSSVFPATQTNLDATLPTLEQRLVSVRRWRDKDLLALLDPHFIIAIRNVVGALKLPSFASLPTNSSEYPLGPEFPLAQLGAVDPELAPHALLALLTKMFVRVLVESGLEASRHNQKLALGLLIGPEKGRYENGRGVRVLTPLHVMTGIVTHKQGDDLWQAVFGCLTRLQTTGISYK